jgi:DNA polymerase I-like protein with 3'-5' exonuclease and polymerase domains
VEQHDICFDLETTARGPDNSPEAQYAKNKLVLCGFSTDTRFNSQNNVGELVKEVTKTIAEGKQPRLIAHNLKFDLKWLLREAPEVPWHKCAFVCTMTAHYRISGHRFKFVSLEDLCAKYSIPFTKGLDLGGLIKQGVDIDDIDKGDLGRYLMKDVKAVQALWVQMVSIAEDYDYDYILPLARMELNGLPLNEYKTRKELKKLTNIHDTAVIAVEGYVRTKMVWSDGSPVARGDFKPLAPRTISYYLTGKPAHGLGGKNDKKHIVFGAATGPILSDKVIEQVWGKTKPNPNLGYPINAAVMETLIKLQPNTVGAYKEAKDANKIINTYLIPFLTEANITGGTIHPKLNTCSTNTGRLSSSSPNGQNIPPSVRNLIASTEGYIYEIDWQQLEMIGAATLSGDANMRQDIVDGRDIHFESGKTVFGWRNPLDMRKDERRTVKGVNFGLLYGGGAAGIALNTGADKKVVKQLIQSFYDRYPGVAKWQDQVLKEIKNDAWVEGTKDGQSYKGSVYQIPNAYGGRRFYFEESESPLWKQHQDGCKFSFKPTETKNYPIQGFAGGDIVMNALTILDAVLASTDAKLRMTVHDSIVVDWGKDKQPELERIMTKVCNLVSTQLNIPVPLVYDIEADECWL